MNNHLITKLTKILLYGLMAVCFANIVSSVMQINLLNDYFVRDIYSESVFYALMEANDFRVGVVSIFFGIILLLSPFVIGRWLYVAAKINHLTGIKGLRFSAASAVWWYAIPFVNLVMPYRSMQETFKASFNSENWKDIKVPYGLHIWWITFVAAGVLGNLASIRMSRLEETYTYEQINNISYIEIASDFSLIINAFFLLGIIKKIADNQKDKEFRSVPDLP